MYRVALATALLACCMTSSCVISRHRALFLIPEGYVGTVVVVFEQSKGSPCVKRNDQRIYAIPTDGTLLTSCDAPAGTSHDVYLYMGKDSISKRLSPVFYHDEASVADSSVELGVFDHSYGSFIESGRVVRYYAFNVRTRRSFYNVMIKLDSVRESLGM